MIIPCTISDGINTTPSLLYSLLYEVLLHVVLPNRGERGKLNTAAALVT